MRTLLAKLFGVAVRARLRLYGSGLLKRRRLSRPVISVGNLTLGGTGKTPFVAYLARLLVQLGYSPTIISRGYKGDMEKQGGLVSDGESTLVDATDCGDEPYMLARTLRGVPVAVGRDRLAAGQALEKQFGEVVHILDDGFQHLGLQRNLDVLLIDGTRPFGNGHLVPRGRLREPVSSLSRADLIIITRAHLSLSGDDIEMQIRRHHPSVPIAYFYHDAVAVRDLASGERQPLRAFTNSRVVALAAIGNPDVFLQDVAHYQIDVAEHFFFRDHHPFSQKELDKALDRRRRVGARCVLTTEKDAVRLESLRFGEGDIFVFEIEARPEDRAANLEVWRQEMENLPDPH